MLRVPFFLSSQTNKHPPLKHKHKTKQIVRYAFGGADFLTPVLHYPSPYTPCAQQLPGSGAWMLPGADGAWLCARPVE